LPNRLILLGVIGRAHGVRGQVRVSSHTADPAALTGYGPLSGPNGRRFTLRWVGEGIAEIAEILDGVPVKIAGRTEAERLTNTKLFIERDRLPPPDDDEYYLADLIGLTAVDSHGASMGVVSAVHDFGAGTSLEITRDDSGSLLIPFTMACVPSVDIASGRLTIVPPDEIDVVGTAEPPAPASTRHGVSSTRHDGSSTRHGVSSTRHDGSSTRHGVPSTRHGPARPGHPVQDRASMDSPAKPDADGKMECAA
jgi:16S rRNA processing protein RimM